MRLNQYKMTKLGEVIKVGEIDVPITIQRTAPKNPNDHKITFKAHDIVGEWGEVLGTFRKEEIYPLTKAGLALSNERIAAVPHHGERQIPAGQATRTVNLKGGKLRGEYSKEQVDEINAIIEHVELLYNYGENARLKNYIQSLLNRRKFTEVELIYGKHPEVRGLFEGDGTGFTVEIPKDTTDYRNKKHGGAGRKRKARKT